MEKQQTTRKSPAACRVRRGQLDDMIHRLEDIDSKVSHVIFRLKDTLRCAKRLEEENEHEVAP